MKTLNPTTSAVAAPNGEQQVPVAPRVFGATREKQRFSIEWAAGFVDGEGCIHIARQTYRGKRRETWKLRCYISQNDLEVLEHFRGAVGIDAPIYKVRRTKQQNKQVYTLNFEGKKAMALVALLMPHLIRKREEAQAAMTYWVEGRVGKRWGPKGIPPEIAAFRERMYFKLRSLK
jgi:hypothetical protein